MLLARLNSTQDCIKMAKTITLTQIEELNRLRKVCVKSSKKWCETEAWDIALIMATKAQFCKETIQFFNKGGNTNG